MNLDEPLIKDDSTYFKQHLSLRGIDTVYSDQHPEGIKFCIFMKTMYCYLEGWRNSNLRCFESQTSLATVISATRKTANEVLQKLESVGLLKRIRREKTRGFYYESIPITRRHITPPDKEVKQQDQKESLC